jgi:hypothetical protein
VVPLILSLSKKTGIGTLLLLQYLKNGPNGYLKRLPTQHAFELRKLCLNPKPFLRHLSISLKLCFQFWLGESFVTVQNTLGCCQCGLGI